MNTLYLLGFTLQPQRVWALGPFFSDHFLYSPTIQSKYLFSPQYRMFLHQYSRQASSCLRTATASFSRSRVEASRPPATSESDFLFPFFALRVQSATERQTASIRYGSVLPNTAARIDFKRTHQPSDVIEMMPLIWS